MNAWLTASIVDIVKVSMLYDLPSMTLLNINEQVKLKSKFVTSCKTGYLLYGLECWQVKNIPKHPHKMGLAAMRIWLMNWSALNRKEWRGFM